MELRVAGTDEFQSVKNFYWELIDLMGSKQELIG